jgi:photosystem II stability/assembly factor-like uncharacterized protein
VCKCELLLILAGVGIATHISTGCAGGRQFSRIPALQSRHSTVLGVTSGPKLVLQQSGTIQRLQAVSPVDSRVVWASGLGGTFVVTSDGGKNWRAGVVPGADSLQFRDVEGISATTAYLLAAGTGTASRIYKTTDGGRSWTLLFQNREPQAFYDCLSFWSPARGLAFSDAAGGRFHVMRSGNGISWEDIGNQMPEPLAGEAAFAASGTCVTMIGDRHGWIATGGAAVARVLATTDHGDSWQAYTTPLLAGPSAGAFTIAFRDSLNGIVAGGTLDTSNNRPVNRVAVSADGGRSWRLVSPPPFAGAVFGLSYVPAAGRQMVVATGPGGAAWSSDEGRTWMELAGVKDYWAVAFTGTTGWLVGTEGRILKTTF